MQTDSQTWTEQLEAAFQPYPRFVSEISQAITELQCEFEATQKNLHDEIERKDRELGVLEAKLIASEKVSDAVKGSIEASIATSMNQVATDATDAEAVRAANDMLLKQITILKAEIEALKVGELKAKQAQAEAEFEYARVKSDFDNAKNAAMSRAEQLSQTEEQLARANAKVEELQSAAHELAQSSSSSSSALQAEAQETVQRIQGETQAQIERIREEVAESLRHAQEEARQAKADAELAKNRLEALTQQHSEVAESTFEQESELSTFKDKLAHAYAEMEKLKEQVAGTPATLVTSSPLIEAQLVSAREEIARLQSALDAAKSEAAASHAGEPTRVRNRSENGSRYSERQKGPSLPERVVLLVDDAEINRVLLSHYFKGLPVKLDFASSIVVAAQKCKERNFDLVVVDDELQGLDTEDFQSVPSQKRVGLSNRGHVEAAPGANSPFERVLNRGQSREQFVEQLKAYLWSA